MHLDYYSRLRLPNAEYVAYWHERQHTGHRVKITRRG
jgi:hypothetical protein